MPVQISHSPYHINLSIRRKRVDDWKALYEGDTAEQFEKDERRRAGALATQKKKKNESPAWMEKKGKRNINDSDPLAKKKQMKQNAMCLYYGFDKEI